MRGCDDPPLMRIRTHVDDTQRTHDTQLVLRDHVTLSCVRESQRFQDAGYHHAVGPTKGPHWCVSVAHTVGGD